MHRKTLLTIATAAALGAGAPAAFAQGSYGYDPLTRLLRVLKG